MAGYITKLFRIPLNFKSPVDLSCLPYESRIYGVCFFSNRGSPAVLKNSSTSYSFFMFKDTRYSKFSDVDYNMPKLVFSDGSESVFSWDSINGNPKWTGAWTVWWSADKGWVAAKYDGCKSTEPTEFTNPISESVSGDEYYVLSLPTFTSSSKLTPGPVLKYKEEKRKAEDEAANREHEAAEDITVQFKWEAYIGEEVDSTGCGKYKLKKYGPQSDSDNQSQQSSDEDVRIVGNPQWVNGKTKYIRSTEKINGDFTYGAVHKDKGSWVIGTKDSSSGWWEGPEPQAEQDAVFSFVKPPDSEDLEDQKPIELKWSGYVIGPDTTGDFYVGDVAKWL